MHGTESLSEEKPAAELDKDLQNITESRDFTTVHL